MCIMMLPMEVFWRVVVMCGSNVYNDVTNESILTCGSNVYNDVTNGSILTNVW